MKVLIHPDKDSAVECATEIMAQENKDKPNAVLGLATGGTMVERFKRLAAISAERGLGFSELTTFNLDEYIGLPPDHPGSYHTYMKECLFSRVDIDPARTYLPRGDAANPEAEAARYDSLIEAIGGIDL